MTKTDQAGTQSMVRRVAEALALADLDDETREIVNIDAHMEHVGEHYEELARAAIEAMREPTEEMAAAWFIEDTRVQNEPVLLKSAQMVWGAMIDEALSEEGE